MTTKPSMSVQDLTTMIRDVVEGLHGRPSKRRGVQIVLAEVICTDLEAHWIAKVKFGGAIVAKCCFDSAAHATPEDALLALWGHTRKVLGVRD